MVKKFLRILVDVFTILIICFAIMTVVFIVKVNKDKSYIPGVGSHKFMVVLSDSMNPVFRVKDMIIIKNISEDGVKVDDIITFKEKDVYVTHRVVGIDSENGLKRYKTKGDSNETEDLNLVSDENIVGKYVGRIPYLGFIVQKLKEPIIIAITSGVLGFLFVYELFLYLNNKAMKKEPMSDGKQM